MKFSIYLGCIWINAAAYIVIEGLVLSDSLAFPSKPLISYIFALNLSPRYISPSPSFHHLHLHPFALDFHRREAMVFLSKPLPSTSPVCSWKAGSEEKSTHQPRLSRVLLRWRTRKRELIMDGKIRGDASVLDIDLKSTIDSDVVNVYGEDCATADQPVTPCTFSVARDILEHILWNFVQTDTIN